MAYDALVRKLNDRTAVVAVIGLGYVGLPLALRFSESGYRVIGLDIDKDKVKQLNAGRSYIRHIPANAVSAARSKGFTASADMSEVGKALYGQIVDRVVPVNSTRTAELAKLLENIHRAVNIGLVNEMKIIADKMGIDIYEVIRAASTKPFGFVPYYPGPGLGGHCIPIDPFYLTWKARTYGIHTRFIELAGEINSAMPEWVVGKVVSALNGHGKAVKGSRILVLGIAYKKNVDDTRESPGVTIMELLKAKGAEVAYSDPHVPVFPRMREHHFDLRSIPINARSLRNYDCLVIATNHDTFDFELIKQHARLIVDTRGVYLDRSPKIIKA